MLRALIVLPLYLAAMYFVPQTEAYERFQAVVFASEPYLMWHIAGYSCALVIAIVWALIIEFGKPPHTYALAVLTQVLKLGLVGVMFASAYQLFQFFTSGDLSVFVLIVPPMFMAAELIYLFIEFLISSVQGRRAEIPER
jgi:hypothetical protein